MPTIQERIKERRCALNLTLLDIANSLNVKEATVQRYESGEIKNIKHDTVVELARILQCSPQYLMGWTDNLYDAPTLASTKKRFRVPVLGRVAAGYPIEAVENIIDYEEISEAMASAGEYFALQVKGDSMLPRFTDGDIVIVKKQEDIESGDIAIILVNGNEATIKKVQKFEDGINLIPSNPAYDVMTFTKKEILSLPVVCLGKVVELRAKF